VTTKEKEWPLEVYRRVSSGWEKQVPINHEAYQPSLGPNATGCPKAGCIVIKRFRLKIALTGQAGEEQEPSTDSTKRQKRESRKGFLEVVRRRDCLLLSSRNRLRAILLKFPSVRDCLEFSDELVLLNRGLCVSPGTSAKTKNGGSKSKAALKELILSDGETLNPQGTADVVADPRAVEIQKNEVESHMALLLADKNFQKLTNKIQACMEDNPSLGNLLAATNLHTQDPEREPNA